MGLSIYPCCCGGAGAGCREGGREPGVSLPLVWERAEGLGEGVLAGKHMIQAGEVVGGQVGRALEREYQDRDTASIREVAQETGGFTQQDATRSHGFWAGKESATNEAGSPHRKGTWVEEALRNRE